VEAPAVAREAGTAPAGVAAGETAAGTAGETAGETAVGTAGETAAAPAVRRMEAEAREEALLATVTAGCLAWEATEGEAQVVVY
jgi:hypothetical protein